jgi:hypothetical protein
VILMDALNDLAFFFLPIILKMPILLLFLLVICTIVWSVAQSNAITFI